MELFPLTCATCHAALRVTDPAAIGNILACPRCQSMVEVVPPAGWSLGTAGVVAEPPMTAESAMSTAASGLHLQTWIAVAGAACLVLSAVAVWSYFELTGGESEVEPGVAVAPDSEDADDSTASNKPQAGTPAAPDESVAPPVPAPQAGSEDNTPDADPPPGPIKPAETSLAAADDAKPAEPLPPTAAVKPDSADKPDAPAPTIGTHNDIPPPVTPAEPPASGAEQAAPPDAPSLARIPPRQVDVPARLADALPRVEIRDTPLVEVLEWFTQLTTVPVSFDADALAQLGLRADTLVSVQLADTTAGAVLAAALAPTGLTYRIADDAIVVGRPPAARPRRVRYSVGDLAGPAPDGISRFAAFVRGRIEPDSWRESGGAGGMQWDDSALSVEHNESVHAQVLLFCEKLRVARGLGARSRLDPSRFRLETRSALAAAKLDRKLTAVFARPTPLSQIVSWLRSSTQTVLLIDRSALAADGLSAETEAVLSANDQPLSAALDRLLAPLDLTYRVIDDRTLEITTVSAALAHAELEFHPVGDLLTGQRNAEELARELAGKLADPDRNLLRADWIVFDPASGCLIVRAPQRVQSSLAALLTGRRADLAAARP